LVASHAEDTQDLVDRVRSGDCSAIDEFVARQRLCRLVKPRMDARLAARVDASDVVQGTLLLACQRLSYCGRRGRGMAYDGSHLRILSSAPDEPRRDLTIKWPSGLTEAFTSFQAEQTHGLVEGRVRRS
jgi:hypothetical protein